MTATPATPGPVDMRDPVTLAEAGLVSSWYARDGDGLTDLARACDRVSSALSRAVAAGLPTADDLRAAAAMLASAVSRLRAAEPSSVPAIDVPLGDALERFSAAVIAVLDTAADVSLDRIGDAVRLMCEGEVEARRATEAATGIEQRLLRLLREG